MILKRMIALGAVMAQCALMAETVFMWDDATVASLANFQSLAYNQSFTLGVTFEVGAVEDGTLFEVKGGGKEANKYKRVAFTLSNGVLSVVVAGKSGEDVTVGNLLTLPESGTVRAVMVIVNTTAGTRVPIRAIATGGEECTETTDKGGGFNFDNAAVSGSWEANAPFNTWAVGEGVAAVKVVSSEAWSSEMMAAWVNGTATEGTTFTLNGVTVPSSASLGEIAYNAAFTLGIAFDAETIEEGALIEVKGGGNAADTYKRVAITLSGGVLKGIVAGKNGSDGLSNTILLSALPTSGEVRAVIAVTSGGTSVTKRAVATDDSVQTESGFNFDNTAVTDAWEANAPFDTWTVSGDLTAVEVNVGTAWDADTMIAWATPPVVIETIDIPDGEEVEMPEDDLYVVNFQGGTFVIPEGKTLQHLRLADNSGEGTILVKGALKGVDNGAPQQVAFECGDAKIALESGATLLMDGRLTTAVEILGDVTLGAASAEGVLTLDDVTVKKARRSPCSRDVWRFMPARRPRRWRQRQTFGVGLRPD